VEHEYKSSRGEHKNGIWTFIGYLSFASMGVLLGAVLIYLLFTYLLAPQADLVQPAADENNVVVVLPTRSEEGPGLVSVVEQVMPAVVGVNKHQSLPGETAGVFEEVESGSGVIIAADGYIITNQHVIEGADRISVVIPGKGRYEAELIGQDPLTDLAVLKIDENGLKHVVFGDSSQTKVGETVLAFGNPLGYFQQSVTAGIISAVQRQVRVPGSDYAYTFLQTDALVNPGNSGGPLVNIQGETIGINTAKISLVGVEGIGLSIPSNTVQRVVKDIIEQGKVRRPHLGVIIEDWLEYGEEQPERGVLIRDIAPDSAVDRAGLLVGDIIVAINGEEIYYLAMLFDVLFAYYPGDTVTIEYYREGERFEALVTLGERPDSLPIIQEVPDIDETEDEEDTEQEEEAEPIEPVEPVEP
jgi:serine protease Do